jgi:hypothetical protein
VLQFFSISASGGAVAQLGARLDGIEEVGGSNPPGSTNRIQPEYFTTEEKEGTEKSRETFSPGSRS